MIKNKIILFSSLISRLFISIRVAGLSYFYELSLNYSLLFSYLSPPCQSLPSDPLGNLKEVCFFIFLDLNQGIVEG